jgi:hypothetical protein
MLFLIGHPAEHILLVTTLRKKLIRRYTIDCHFNSTGALNTDKFFKVPYNTTCKPRKLIVLPTPKMA